MKIYNSLTNKVEEFKPVKEKTLTMYVCGPTVYNFIHIGNARPVVFFDLVQSYFKFIGYNVIYASNITDVDDKIIKKAKEENKTEKEITDFYSKAYFDDYINLNSILPNINPYATDYINQMIDFISELIDKGYAYKVNGDVYFRVTKLREYGVLSNQQIDDLEIGHRIKENTIKEDPRDFVLWKETSEGINFNSPFSVGRPGWHTECVVMNHAIFNGIIDIHGGGSDLKFPHHENEIAQSVALHNHPIANYWMHVGRLNLDNEKMSKSLGNIVLVKDLLKDVNPNAFRLLLLSHSYRNNINYSKDLMDQFVKEYDKINNTIKSASISLSFTNEINLNFNNSYIEEFKNEMENDFNTPNVMTIINKLTKEINIKLRNNLCFIEEYNTLKIILNVLNIKYDEKKLSSKDKEVYLNWQEARKNKDFNKADELRIYLKENDLI